MSIQKATISDLDKVIYITQTTIAQIYPHYYPQGAVDFFAEHHNENNILQDIKQDRVFLCYNNEQQAVGTVTIKESEICRLFVLPEVQKQGYGRALLEYAEHVILEQYKEISLDASLPAKEIYLKRGYEVREAHCISCGNKDFLCYDVMVKING